MSIKSEKDVKGRKVLAAIRGRRMKDAEDYFASMPKNGERV